MGRSAKKRDVELAKQVQTLAQYGVSQADIASAVGMSVETLRNLYIAELNKGQALANAQVGKKLFERCMAGDVAALIFWAKCRMRWREKDQPEPAPQVVVKVDKAMDGLLEAYSGKGAQE